MSKLSLREIAQSQLDSTPVIDGQLIVCLDTGNAYRDTATAHVKIGSDLEVVSDLPLAPLAEKLYYLKPDKLYVFLGGNWTLLNDKTIDLDKVIAKLPAGSSTALNDDVEIITQDTDTTRSHYYRRKLVVLWEYIKTKAQDFFAAKNHKHGKADITDFPTSMPASDVHPWAKAATKPSYTKAEVGLGKVDNTADADKTVKRAITAGTADSANSVAWGNVKNKPATFPIEAHTHDDRYYTESEVNTKLNGKLSLSGGTMSGQIKKDTGGSWIGDRDRAVVRSHYPGDGAYGAVAGMPTKNGFWTMGALGGWEDLVFNYSTDSNYSASKNETSQVRLPAQAGTIITSATIGSQSVKYATSAGSSSTATTAAKLGRSGNTGVPMTFNWSGQGGQPTWLWGGNDSSNMYVYNPSNFNVNYATTAGNGTVDFQTKVTTDGYFGAVRFGNGVQICWFTMKSARNRTFLLPFADINYAIAFSGGYCWLNIDNRTTTGFTVGVEWSGYENSYIAIGRWK